MKKSKKIFFVIISVLVVIVFATFLDFDNSKAFESIITFLSITTGFTITALSIMANSIFSKQLYQIEEDKDNSKTLLHTLVYQFKNSTLLFVATIALILLYYFIDDKEIIWKTVAILNYNFSFPIILKSIIWYLTILSFLNFIKLLLLFSKFVIKNATK